MMLVKTNICDKRGCRRKATECYDLKPHGWLANKSLLRHYELCDEHATEYIRCEGWIDRDRSERIKRDLVPS